MLSPTEDVRLYFTPTEETFWRWSADRQAVEWRSGATIVWRVELQMLLESLVPIGLPPLENILLTLAACRNDITPIVEELPQGLTFEQFPMRFSLVDNLAKVIERLRTVHGLPEALRTSTPARKVILALMSENGPRLKEPGFSAQCVEYLRQGYAVGESSPAKTSHDWVSELRGLYDGLAAVNESAIRLRMDVGVETLIIPAPVTAVPLELPEEPVPEPLTVRELLDDLAQDEEHAGLVHLTKRLLAVVSLPRPVSAPNDQPLGGVSDITNRGDFDRLLLSELAQDTDVLMTRVALNEALYIRREVPPGFPPRERCVLLDVGIRMWGLPRLYATAAGLALAAMQDADHSARLYRAISNGVVPIDLAARDDLIAHLGCLELAPHPGESLTAFIEAAGGVPTDFVIVTGEDVLADPDFRNHLNELKQPSLYVVAVTREGDLRLLLRTRQGERVLKQARLDLEEILKKPETAVRAPPPKLRNDAIDPHLPAILRVRPFPLRLYHQIDWKKCGAVDLDQPHAMLLAVTTDRRLMLLTSTEAPRQLTDTLPAGSLLWHATRFDGNDQIRVVVGDVQRGTMTVVTVDITGTECSLTSFIAPAPVLGVHEHGGMLYVASKRHMTLFSLANSQVSSLPVRADLTWMSSRFFRDPHSLHVLSPSPTTWQQLPVMGTTAPIFFKGVFDCESHGCPIVVTDTNEVVLTGDNARLRFIQTTTLHNQPPIDSAAVINAKSPIAVRDQGVPSSVARISPDGNRFILTQGPSKYAQLDVDLTALTVTERWGTPERLIHGKAGNLVTRTNLRHKLSAIGVHQGDLVVRTNRGAALKLKLHDTHGYLYFERQKDANLELDRTRGFRTSSAPPGVGYSLKVATWADNSRAYLDSRGLLHLQSSDRNLSELTLILNDENVAGWCDRNLVWGDPVFVGTNLSKVSPARAYHDWLIPFCRKLE